MRFDPSFMKGKVAKRIFLQFVLSALVPILALAIVSFSQVKWELEKQGEVRLHEASRSLGSFVYERLTFLENDLKIFSLSLDSNPGVSLIRAEDEYVEHLRKRFRAVAFIRESGNLVPLFGEIHNLPNRSPEQEEFLGSGKALVFVRPAGDEDSQIFMMRQVDPQDPTRGMLFGEINSMYLWGLDEHNTLPAMTELTVLDNSRNVVYTTIKVPPEFTEQPVFKRSRSSLSLFEWKYEGEQYEAAFCSVFMKYHWQYPRLIIAMSSPKFHIFAPIAFFKKIFPLVVLLSFWVVLLLSATQIRRTTEPLQELKQGTERIAMKDFDSRVTVLSGDEFEELGASFNDMARQLGRQFNALTTIADIGRAILSSLDTEKIVNTVLTRIKGFFKYDLVGASLLDVKGKAPARIYLMTGKPDDGRLVLKSETHHFSSSDLQEMIENSEILSIDAEKNLPSFLAPFAETGIKSFVVLPLFLKEGLAGVITLGSRDLAAFDQEDLIQARQLANQMAVALSNARLLEELDLFNWGALTALARAVDAKSPWTAGHSERVTKMALSIGRVMGISKEELEDLHRGALLHDIGKIGIPVSILDKNGKLSGEEYRTVQGHPRIGSRILEPIGAYEHIVPFVLQHHERYDGKGYPDGLAGEEISLGGRILAVADVYDALVSDRPYRAGMPFERVVKIIKEETGKQFDPKVVTAFLTLTEREMNSVPEQGKTAAFSQA